MALEVQYMYYISFDSLLYGLFIDIEHVKITLTETIWAYSKFEHLYFYIYFLNKDIICFFLSM